MPLKSSVRGKSRIEVDPALRRRLVLAMAFDTVSAAAADGVRAVLVVLDDPADGDELAEIGGVRILRTRAADLNTAIGDGLAVVAGESASQQNSPDDARPVAVLPADLPSLTPLELAGALQAAAAHHLAVVADRQGTGTTLLAASSIRWLQPRYGGGSLDRHVNAGAVPLDLSVESGLRRDVDQADDLVGVTGPRTIAVLQQAGWVPDLCAARRAV